MKSIFEIENRLNINKEFEKLIEVFLTKEHAVTYVNDYNTKVYGRFIDGVNETVFLEWKYRDTFLNVFDYLDFIGIDEIFLEEGDYNDKNRILLFMEFILNMANLIENSKKIVLMSVTKAAIDNIYLILEKMNYKMKKLDDKIIICKRSADVDSILEVIPEDIASTLLEYNDFRVQNDIKAKQKILKNIDLYIEKNINIKSFDKDLDNAIGTIVNKMGVNHPIKEEPYKLLTDEELIKWYDKCFLMMIHAIRTIEVNKIENERKKLVQK